MRVLAFLAMLFSAAAPSWLAPVAPTPSITPTPPNGPETPDAVARRYALSGELLIARGGRVVLDGGYGTIRPDGGAPHRAGERWRLASITKQVVTTLLLRDHADALDQPIAVGATAPTLRQLPTHRSG